MNLKIAGEESLWDDIWHDRPHKSAFPLNLKSISIGNGFINNRVQSRYNIEYACGGADVPAVADPAECAWARKEHAEAEELMANCRTPKEW